MTPGIAIRKLGIASMLVCLFFFRPEASATNVLTADRPGSSPPDSLVASVPVEKAKHPGLRFRFKCVDQISLADQGNVCFPIHGGVSTVVTIKLGNSAPLVCGTMPGLPGTCWYSFVDAFQHSNTCGPGSNQPCVDTVLIRYNGLLPASTTVQYSAAGVLGVSGELENLANMVSFGTVVNAPSTPARR